MDTLELHLSGVVLRVKAQPKARRNGIVGVHAGNLKVQVSAAPEHGKTTEAVLELIAESFKLKRSQVTLQSGATTPLKRILIAGISQAHLTSLTDSFGISPMWTRLSHGPTMKASPLPEQPSGPLVRRKGTSLRPALRLSWSIIGWRLSTPWSKSCAKKAATFSRRSTIPSTESSLGSSIQKEIRWNFGSRPPANNPGSRPQHEPAPNHALHRTRLVEQCELRSGKMIPITDTKYR